MTIVQHMGLIPTFNNAGPVDDRPIRLVLDTDQSRTRPTVISLRDTTKDIIQSTHRDKFQYD
jgi:hypothetical protein